MIQAMAIKKYFSRKKLQTLGERIKNSDYNRLVIQLMRPESEHHYEVSVSSKAKVNNNDQILYVLMKLNLLFCQRVACVKDLFHYYQILLLQIVLNPQIKIY